MPSAVIVTLPSTLSKCVSSSTHVAGNAAHDTRTRVGEIRVTRSGADVLPNLPDTLLTPVTDKELVSPSAFIVQTMDSGVSTIPSGLCEFISEYSFELGLTIETLIELDNDHRGAAMRKVLPMSLWQRPYLLVASDFASGCPRLIGMPFGRALEFKTAMEANKDPNTLILVHRIGVLKVPKRPDSTERLALVDVAEILPSTSSTDTPGAAAPAVDFLASTEHFGEGAP